MINTCHHGEAFLWHGTGIDEIDDGIMDLIKLSEIRPDIAMDVCDEISSILSTVKNMAELEKTHTKKEITGVI